MKTISVKQISITEALSCLSTGKYLENTNGTKTMLHVFGIYYS